MTLGKRVLSTSLGVAALLAPVLVSGPASAGALTGDQQDQLRGRHRTPVIEVRAGSDLGRVPSGLLGVNHQYNRNGHGMWDAVADEPKPAAVAAAIRSQVRSVRFPGGTLANFYDWKQAIGPDRGCQVDAGREALPGYAAVRDGLAYGPDEHMEFVHAIGAEALIMTPFLNETPSDAADWVEYMNAKVGANPNGGVDWASVRKENGHRAPYGVTRWEIGNELNHTQTRLWLAKKDGVAVRQYAFGATVRRSDEVLGKNCNHRVEGSTSNGAANQVFEVLFPPMDPATTQVSVEGDSLFTWQRVGAKKMAAAGPLDRYYTTNGPEGEITFGDGTHGMIPPKGAHVTASYDSVHQGFFDFAQAMHAVDPSIKVCSSWGNAIFVKVAGSRRYDCVTKHAVTTFEGARGEWDDKVEGHDRLMLGTDEKRNSVLTLRRAIPSRSQLWLTEVVTLQGDNQTWPSWSASESSAVSTAVMWGSWLKLGIPFAMGDDLLTYDRGLLGGAPGFHMTARGMVRQAMGPMVRAGGRRLSTDVRRNPVRHVVDARRDYTGLSVTATRAPNGTVWLMVVNRLPTKSVTANVDLGRYRHARRAVLRRVTAPHFYSWNAPGEAPDVTFHKSRVRLGRTGFSLSFPPASTTVLAIPHR